MDGRLIELPLSPEFLRLVTGAEVQWTDLYQVVPEVADTVAVLMSLIEEKKKILANPDTSTHKEALEALTYKGTSFEDLCLSLCLPSSAEYELVEGGAEVALSVDTMEQYVGGIVEAYLGNGVAQQVKAFQAGFSSLFDIAHLAPFSPREIEILICGENRQLSLASLVQCAKADHGYTNSSPAVRMLFEVLDEMEPADQRRFIMWVTGSPRLPAGGLASLQPRLTIVRKTPEQGRGSDEYLPSVMTCQNYIKLPDYSSKEVMRKRILTAVCEGQGSFHLS